jgi:aspartyl-tRNA(Asn)/glutamyl-tRNA(Gln) amidotransferase subunit B
VKDAPASAFEAVIGLEVHVQLKTRTKLFCGCENRFGAPPNSLTCPVCLGLPGALPVLNRRALELGVRAALGLGAEVARETRFDRKNYFYPDQPKNYQITQYEHPCARGGSVELHGDRGASSIGLARLHLEEDAGKLVHRDRSTDIDLNRSGVPLLEIVTRPEIRSPEEAYRCLSALKRTLRYLDVSDCNMEQGSLRCDANISVRPRGESGLGTKVEVKNLNSFRAVRRALAHEFDRQVGLLASGRGRLVRETRQFDDRAGVTRPLRSKEAEEDYRYFPEPDLPPVRIAAETIEAARAALPELPAAKATRLVSVYSIPAYDAWVLVEDPRVADYFEAVARDAGCAKEASNWVMTHVKRVLNEGSATIESFPIPPEELSALIRLKREGRLSTTGARRVFDAMLAEGGDATTVARDLGLEQPLDPVILETRVREAMAANPRAVIDVRKGKTRAKGALIGHVMRATEGKANPTLVREIVDRVLREGTPEQEGEEKAERH